MRNRSAVRTLTVWGALADLVVFLLSFGFSGGAHGPAGPMFVLSVINRPLAEAANWLIPMERSSNALDLVMMFLVVILSGGLYGFVVGSAVSAWKILRSRMRRKQETSNPGGLA